MITQSDYMSCVTNEKTLCPLEIYVNRKAFNPGLREGLNNNSTNSVDI